MAGRAELTSKVAIIGIYMVTAILIHAVERLADRATHADVEATFDAVIAQPPPAYGTNVWWSDQEANLWTERWAELGPSHVRLFVSHALIEPENDNDDPNVINWDEFRFESPISVPIAGIPSFTYRAWFEALRDQAELDIVIHFVYLAPWLSDNSPHMGIGAPYPPNDLDEYEEFVEAVLRYLVDTLGFPPERLTIEAMNEPDLGCGVDPVTFCFWDDWTMGDIVDVVHVTHEVIENVDPKIALIGLAECCGTDVVRNLLDHYSEGDDLDGVSYHYYSPSGYNLTPALSRAAELAPYKLPIYFDEYGSREYLSDGVDGALWHSWALLTLWKAGIAPLQYPISEFQAVGEPYSSMGLFENSEGGWRRKPSYWVYVNFFDHVGGGEIISHSSSLQAEVDVLAARHILTDSVRSSFWVVNRGVSPLSNCSFTLHGFPYEETTLYAYDNLVGSGLSFTATITGSPLVFTAILPARSSRTFVLSAGETQRELDHVSLTPGVATVLAGQAMSYTLTAYDIQEASWDATVFAVYTIEPGAGGEWAGHVYTAEVAGTWTVTGTYGGESDTATLEVWAPEAYLYLPLILREK